MELEKLQQIIAEVLNVDASEVMPGTTFTEDLGADSLDLYQIILGVEDAFDIEIPQEEAEKIYQLCDWLIDFFYVCVTEKINPLLCRGRENL